MKKNTYFNFHQFLKYISYNFKNFKYIYNIYKIKKIWGVMPLPVPVPKKILPCVYVDHQYHEIKTASKIWITHLRKSMLRHNLHSL